MESRWTARAGTLSAAVVALVFLAGTAQAAPVPWTLQQPPSPTVGADPNLMGVSCATPSDCVAVGNDSQTTYTEIWDGTSWALTTFPDASESSLDAVSCTTSGGCTAVGTVADTAQPGTLFPLAIRWDGTSWTVQTVSAPVGSILTGVSCTSATRCVAVSNQDVSEVWNGRVWKAYPVSVALSSVSCTSNKFCIGVGGDDASAELWDGSTWTAMTVPTPAGQDYGGFYSVSCGSATSCAAVGYYEMDGIRYPLVDHWDGTSWTMQSLPASNGSVSLNGVSCARPGDVCTAVGNVSLRQSEKPLVEHWNGTEWKRDWSVVVPPDSQSSNLSAVFCRTGVTCVAVGSSDAKDTGIISLLAEHES